MQKKHVSPEFTVIKQNEANAKFFVASFTTRIKFPLIEDPTSEGTTSSVATKYGNKDDKEIDLDDVFK